MCTERVRVRAHLGSRRARQAGARRARCAASHQSAAGEPAEGRPRSARSARGTPSLSESSATRREQRRRLVRSRRLWRPRAAVARRAPPRAGVCAAAGASAAHRGLQGADARWCAAAWGPVGGPSLRARWTAVPRPVRRVGAVSIIDRTWVSISSVVIRSARHLIFNSPHRWK